MRTNFQSVLETLLGLPALGRSQQKLAAATGIDVAQLNRIVRGTFGPTPEVVGRLVGTLPGSLAAIVMKAYLDDLVAAAGTTKRPKNKDGGWKTSTWQSPGDVLTVTIQVEISSKK